MSVTTGLLMTPQEKMRSCANWPKNAALFADPPSTFNHNTCSRARKQDRAPSNNVIFPLLRASCNRIRLDAAFFTTCGHSMRESRDVLRPRHEGRPEAVCSDRPAADRFDPLILAGVHSTLPVDRSNPTAPGSLDALPLNS